MPATPRSSLAPAPSPRWRPPCCGRGTGRTEGWGRAPWRLTLSPVPARISKTVKGAAFPVRLKNALLVNMREGFPRSRT